MQDRSVDSKVAIKGINGHLLVKLKQRLDTSRLQLGAVAPGASDGVARGVDVVRTVRGS